MRRLRHPEEERRVRRIKNRLYRTAHPEVDALRKASPAYKKRERLIYRRKRAEERLRTKAPLVLDVVCTYYDVSLESMRHPTSKKRISCLSDLNYAYEARMIAASLLGKTFAHIGPTEAGRLLNLDHSTVMHHQARLYRHGGSQEESTAKRECLAIVRQRWRERTTIPLPPPPLCGSSAHPVISSVGGLSPKNKKGTGDASTDVSL